jgi:oligosaccharide repeat unit polymerase
MIRRKRNPSPLLLQLAGLLLMGVPLFFRSEQFEEAGTVTIVLSGYIAVLIGMTAVAAPAAFYKQRMGKLLFLLGNLYWFVVPAFQCLVLGPSDLIARKIHDTDYLITTCVLLGLFAAVGLIAYNCYRPNRRQPRPNRLGPPLSLDQYRTVTLSFYVLGFLPFIIFGGSIQAVLSGVLGSRSAQKDWSQGAFQSNPVAVIGRACLVTAGALALSAVVTKRKGRAQWLFLFFTAFVITYFDSGTRSWTIMMLVPSLMELIRGSIAKGRAQRWLVLAPILIVTLIAAAQLQRQFRSNGGVGDVSNLEEVNVSHDYDFFSESAVAVSLIRDSRDWYMESITYLFLTNPIPRSLWANKPYPRTIEGYGIGREGRDEYLTRGVSRLPSVVGQQYMSWGLAGVIGIAIEYGLLLAFIDFLWTRPSSTPLQRLWAGTTAAWLFVCFRGMYPGFHYPVILLGGLCLYERSQRRKVVRDHSRRFTAAAAAQGPIETPQSLTATA